MCGRALMATARMWRYRHSLSWSGIARGKVCSTIEGFGAADDVAQVTGPQASCSGPEPHARRLLESTRFKQLSGIHWDAWLSQWALC